MQPSDGSAPPVDRTGFPQWWKSHPKNWLASVHILDRLASGPAFNLSDYIINQAEAKMRQETKEEVMMYRCCHIPDLSHWRHICRGLQRRLF